MALTAKQFGFLLKQKVIKKNSLISVKRKKVIDISENYEKHFNFEDNGFIIKVYEDPKNDTYKIIYIKEDNHNLNYVCDLDAIVKIEGQEVDRYYKAYLDLLANANPIIIEDLTNVEKDVIDKVEANVGKYELYEGMKFILKNDVNSKYNNKILNARNVGKRIKLTGNAGRPKK